MCDGVICEKCWHNHNYNQMSVLIAQEQRALDLLERIAGYDNEPLFIQFPQAGGAALATATDYQLPPFEMAANMFGLQVSTDATAVQIGAFIYHESITLPNGRMQIGTFQGSAQTFALPPAKYFIPARGKVGVRFIALTGGTYISMMASYARSEQTTIEWFRGQRAGRIA
jgi:hypothetical protein